MKKKVCMLLALLMLASIMGGCQVIEETAIGAGLAEHPSDESAFDEMQAEREAAAAKEAELEAQGQAQEAEDPVMIPLEEIPDEEAEPVPTDCSDCRDKAAQAVPISTTAPIPAPDGNTPEQIRELAKPLCDYYWQGYDPAKHDQWFLYASMPSNDDWSYVSKNRPSALYNGLPVNMFIATLDGQPSQYMTNKELVAELGEAKVKDFGKKGQYYAGVCMSNVPDEMNVDTMKKQYLDAGLPESEAAKLAKERVDYHMKEPYYRDCIITGDDMLVYRDALGNIRVRTFLDIIVREGTDQALKDINVKRSNLNTWWGAPVETIIELDGNGNIRNMSFMFIGDFGKVVSEEMIERNNSYFDV